MADQPPLRYQREFVPFYSVLGQQAGADAHVQAAPAGAVSAGTVPAGAVIPGQVKVYAHGRYQDPLDPTVTHERSVIYRKETSAQMNMSPAADSQVIIGPTLNRTPTAFHPVVIEQELAHEKAKYAEGAQAMLKSQAGQIAAVKKLEDRCVEMMKMMERQSAALEKSEGKLAQRDAEIAELKKRLEEANKPTDYKGDAN